ncbi:MAG: hypothetical protein KatS3mg033_2276 [Thermonema sp.]|uniref:hypothetical protein n=1 Tax=Thermonema sp. TaxID=2231181 RepID=UPI0021DE16EE|nr:hypothetical protein [Thermonema sp.]GIV40476.1 MAG: hypothetical protein KatS3mg033_2276 [Thermonema sp.]
MKRIKNILALALLASAAGVPHLFAQIELEPVVIECTKLGSCQIGLYTVDLWECNGEVEADVYIK